MRPSDHPQNSQGERPIDARSMAEHRVEPQNGEVSARHAAGRWRVCSRWLQASLLLLFVSLGGCNGCVSDESETLTREELERRRRERRESIEKAQLVSLPADSGTKILTAKQGHWYETQHRLKSNREDLQIEVAGTITRGGEAARPPGTNIISEFTRRTALPKGQWKTVEMQYFVPFTGKKKLELLSNESNRLDFNYQLRQAPLMTPLLPVPERTTANELDPHVFQFVVVGPNAMQYEYVAALDTVLWKMGPKVIDSARTRSYFVSLVAPEENRYALPHSMLTMTATAVLLWDDVAAEDLALDQQQAIVDWVHWGGQLLISGPGSWTRLQNSFLSPYLPVRSATSAELTTDDFAELSQRWSTVDLAESDRQQQLVIAGDPVGGLRFTLSSRGQWLPDCGELVAEAPLGRGRIVVTSFALREPRIFRWKYFSSFLSTGLLRRHPRTIPSQGQLRGVQTWSGPLAHEYRDPRLNSNLRILSRDLPLSSTGSNVVGNQSLESMIREQQSLDDAAFLDLADANPMPSGVGRPPTNRSPDSDAVPQSDETQSRLEQADRDAFEGDDRLMPNVRESLAWGIGGGMWNDFSGLSVQTVQALKRAAGIELPSRMTIIYLLAGYLAILVPVNWLFFKLLGRLEYAWVAAPVLAMIGVVVVTRVAQLDIGFARRTTEIAVLELHEDHPRAHLTRYLALYTSLSTSYSAALEETGSVALPLGDFSRSSRRSGESDREIMIAYDPGGGIRLEPLTVYSNSTEMLHVEQMLALDGGLVLGRLGKRSEGEDAGGTAEPTDETSGSATREAGESRPALKNRTGLDIRSALVLRRTVDGQLERAWLGDLTDSASRELAFAPATALQDWSEWRKNPETTPIDDSNDESTTIAADVLWIGNVMREIAAKTPLLPGQSRLIGYTDSVPGKLELKPSQDQYDARCVIVAHLTPQNLGPVQPDARILSRVSDDAPDPLLIDQQPDSLQP